MIRQYNEPFKWPDEPQADGVVTNPFHIFSYTDITEKMYICNVVFIPKYIFAR